MEKQFFVYLLASQKNGTLHLGVTSNLVQRIWQHKHKALPGFTSDHGVDRLVWFEAHESAEAAIFREKQLKKWRRDWKTQLIECDNPDWVDLWPRLVGAESEPQRQPGFPRARE